MRTFSNLQKEKRRIHSLSVLLFFSIISYCFFSSCATGSYIITGNVRPAIDPMTVKVYLDPPTKYETIGIVEASSDVGFSSQEAQNRTIEKLKQQAAKLGANGVLLKSTENKAGGGVIVYGAYVTYDTKTARGEAIYVIQE